MWADLVAWFQSPGGARVLQTAIIPAAAILVAGVLAALIGRAAVRSSIARADRVEAAGAVAGLVEAARAASDGDTERSARRRAARLRTEADVRTRLLPLPNAAAAADWAAARTEAIQQRAAEGPVTAELDDLRDRLVAWVDRPGRAKRIFTASPAAPVTSTAAPAQAPTQDKKSRRRSTTVEPPAAAAPSPAAAPPAAAAPTAAAPVAAEPAAAPARTAAVPVASAAEAAGLAGESVPAWQRTRSGERLQQESAARGRPVEPPTRDLEDDETSHTAPVQLQHPHRAEGAPAADVDEAIRLEAHQQARHARPSDAAPAATGAQPAVAPPKAGGPAPAWLDQYDDEAQVTQNLDLKTPPPVSASAVRDRGGPGEDLVPRS